MGPGGAKSEFGLQGWIDTWELKHLFNFQCTIDIHSKYFDPIPVELDKCHLPEEE